MKDCKHDDSMSFNAIEDGIREAACLHATNVAVLDGKTCRVFCSEIDHAIDLSRELNSKMRLLLLVPQCCVVKFGTRGAPKDDL